MAQVTLITVALIIATVICIIVLVTSVDADGVTSTVAVLEDVKLNAAIARVKKVALNPGDGNFVASIVVYCCIAERGSSCDIFWANSVFVVAADTK